MPTISKTATTSATATDFQTDTYALEYTTQIGPLTPVRFPTSGVYAVGTVGNDVLNGTFWADELHGLDGNDTLSSGAGNDKLFGDAGNDYLVAGDGNDTADGGSGNDYLMAGNGTDTFIGGTGSDTLDYSTMTTSGGITVDLTSGYNNAGDTISGIENLVGTAFSDILNGDANNNKLTGGTGGDWLFGQGGNDIIDGGAGDDNLMGGDGVDYIYGGTGDDRMTGGLGVDFFVLTPTGGFDNVTDFVSGTDKIGLSGFGAKPFGNDGLIAYGEFGYEVGPGHYRNTHFVNLDSSDKLLYDYHTQTLYTVDPVFINGKIANYNAEAIAIIHYDPSSPTQVAYNDFQFM